jgi:hypothetical protein
MRGLDPRIHPLRKTLSKKMDCRVKPGNDGHGVRGGPGSAKQRFAKCYALHRARDTAP